MSLLSVGLGLAGIYSKWRGAHEATKNMDDSMTKVKGELGDWKLAFDKYNTMSEDYMDSTSGLNQNLLNQFQQSGMDFSNAQNRMSSRNLSSGGLGGFSGFQNALQDANFAKAQNQSQESWQNALAQNRNTGISLMDRHVQNQKGYSENLAQGWIQNDIMKRQMEQSKWSGLGSGLLGLLT